jgi:hypothetical protein
MLLALVGCAAAQPRTDPPKVEQNQAAPQHVFQAEDPEVAEPALSVSGKGKVSSPTYESQPRKPLPARQKGAGPILCVDGTLLECDDRHVQWNGKACCMIRAGACGEGTRVDCNEKNDASMHWTGKGCCVENAKQCAPAEAASCDGKGKHWTGKMCCE